MYDKIYDLQFDNVIVYKKIIRAKSIPVIYKYLMIYVIIILYEMCNYHIVFLALVNHAFTNYYYDLFYAISMSIVRFVPNYNTDMIKNGGQLSGLNISRIKCYAQGDAAIRKMAINETCSRV